METDRPNKIYFLKLNDQVSSYYLKLAGLLNEQGISLIPITIDYLQSMQSGEQGLVVSLATDLLSFFRLSKMKKRYLDFAVLNRKIYFIDISSIPPSRVSRRVDNRPYLHIALPQSLESLAMEIGRTFRQEANRAKSRQFKNRAVVSYN